MQSPAGQWPPGSQPYNSGTASSSASSNGSGSGAQNRVAKLSAIATKEDPEKLYQLIEIIGTGSYGEVYKVLSFSSLSN